MFGQTFGRKNSDDRRAGELLEVLGQLLLVRAPREVRVGLAEPDLGQAVHHLRPGERLGQEERLRVRALELAERPLPEREGLGVRVVDAEDLDAVADPELEDRAQLVPQALPVLGLEVERVDVLVLLRRVLGVLDRAVGALAEPGRVLRDERVVGRDLEGDVERDADATGSRPRRRARRSPRACRGPGGWPCGRRPARRSPRARPGRRARSSSRCSGPCGTSSRSGGSAAGRGRRSRAPARTRGGR